MPGLDAETVVVGAGIIGAAAARAIAAGGRTVALVERFDVGHDRGSSHGTSRIFRLSYPDQRYVRLAQVSLTGWRELEAEHGAPLLVTTGSLDLGSHAAANAHALSACGARFEIVEGATVTGRWPVSVTAGERVLHQPDAGTILADRSLRALVDGATAAGASLHESTEVRAITSDRTGARVDTSNGTIRCRAVVVAAGAWSARLLDPLGVQLPVVPTRETVAHFSAPNSDSVPCVVDDAAPHGESTPPPGRAGSLAYALSSPGIGVKVGLHHSGPPTDPDAAAHADPSIVDWARAWVARRMPQASPSPVATETCIYTNTADEGFVLARHGRVVVASACSGHAFKFAPALGRTIAGLAAEVPR